MPCPTFIEKCLLCFSDRSIVTCWNAGPTQQILCISKLVSVKCKH